MSFLFLYLLVAGCLQASTWKAEELIRRFELAPWKIGMFRVQPQLVLTDFGYDSNVYHQTNAIDDYSFTAGPQITSYLSLKRKIIFTITESPRYVYYFETARERTWNNYLDAKASFLLTKFFIQVGAHLNDAQQRISYEVDIRPRLKDTGYDALLLWQPSRKTSFSLAFKQIQYRYENIAYETLNIAERLNRDETAFNLTFFNQLTARTRAFVDLEYIHADFTLGSNPRDALSYAAYGGFEFSTLGRVRGRLRLGYKLFHPLTAGYSDYQGLVGDTNISISILRPLVLRGSYRRDIRYSMWYGNSYYIEDSSGAGASFYVFRRRIRLDYDYSQMRYDYPAVVQIPSADDPSTAPLSSRMDRVNMHALGFFFRIGESVGLGLRAGRYIRTYSGSSSGKINRDFIGLNLTYEF